MIIDVAATPDVAGYRTCEAYINAKLDLIAITKDIALESYHESIGAFTLALGNTSLDAAFASLTQAEGEEEAIESTMKRCGSPREVVIIAANAANYDDFSFAAANTVVIDWGMVRL